MLIQEQLQSVKLSSVERVLADFLMAHLDQLKDLTSTRLARKTYTSPAAVVRLAQRLGFDGWTSFKKALLKESDYLRGAFENVDANYPFNENDTEGAIAASLAALYQESVRDSLQLMDEKLLEKAADLLEQADKIVLFCLGDLAFLGERFTYQLERIGIECRFAGDTGMYAHTAHQLTENQCALLISYSGETPAILECASILQENGVPFTAITSIGNNSLSSMADITLPVTTREKMISKIYSFSSSLSISLMLDILYGILYARDYKKHNSYKTGIARKIETKRNIQNAIIQEKEN